MAETTGQFDRDKLVKLAEMTGHFDPTWVVKLTDMAGQVRRNIHKQQFMLQLKQYFKLFQIDFIHLLN